MSMFKKLKQKISEEQLPHRTVSSPAHQTPPKSAAQPPANRSHASSLSSRQDESTLTPDDRELLAGMIAEPSFLSEYTIFALDHTKRPKADPIDSVNVMKPDSPHPVLDSSINGNEMSPVQKAETQSFAQKLQLRVPSMESLFRSPSKESLVRTASRESLNRLVDNDPPGTPTYDPPSDIESEAEDSLGSMESLNKEQLLQRLRRMERSLGNYRGKYSELVTAYRTVQRDKEKVQSILSQSQDKALRRIGELREELQMDQQAKKHLQEEFDAALEEKDQFITVLQTQVALLKQRLHGTHNTIDVPVEDVKNTEGHNVASTPLSPTIDVIAENSSQPEDNPLNVEALQKRVKRQENLLQRCKEMVRTQKERSLQLSSEKDALQEQLQERLQELEKMKELHTSEKTKLITQLRDAKNLVEQLEQDKGMVIAETKRQMHETLEIKEEEIVQLRSRLQQSTAELQELKEQKEKVEKSAFEELEKALSTTNKVEEETRRQLKAQMEAQIKAIEASSEEERKSLQQELTRVKQEVVGIMKKSSEDRIVEIEKVHSETLASREEELKLRLETREAEFQELMRMELEKCRNEYTHMIQDKEQQSALALEELELQKSALQSQSESKLRDMQEEMEALRTKVLELESFQAMASEGAVQLEAEKDRHQEEHKVKIEEQYKELEKVRKESEEKQEALQQEHCSVLKELQDKHQQLEASLKEKESQFHAHIEEMNQKTLEKLDVKQMELEALSAELSEALTARTFLEAQVSGLSKTIESMKVEYERKLEQETSHYIAELNGLKTQHEQSLGGMEKTLKEELNNLKMVLEDREKQLEVLQLKEQKQIEYSEKACQESTLKLEEIANCHRNQLQGALDEKRVVEEQYQKLEQQLEELRENLKNVLSEKESLIEASAKLKQLDCEVESYKSRVQVQEKTLAEIQTDSDQKMSSLQSQHAVEIGDLQHHVEELKRNLEQEKNSVADMLEEQLQQKKMFTLKFDEQHSMHEQRLDATKTEYENKIRVLEGKMDKIKQKAKEMQEKFKQRLSEQESNLKEELGKRQKEMIEKEKNYNEKMTQMAKASSAGLSDAVSQLDSAQKEQMENLQAAHRRELEDLNEDWRKKLKHQEEQMVEKHESEQQEKVLELKEVKEKLESLQEEKERFLQEVNRLREDLVIRETTVQKLQTELKEAAGQVETLSKGDAMLKEQLEGIEKNLSQALSERNTLQDQLVNMEDESKNKINELMRKLEQANEEIVTLKDLHSRDGADHQKVLDEKVLEIQTREEEFKKLLLRLYNEVCSKLEISVAELCDKFNLRLRSLNERIIGNQKRTLLLKDNILSKQDRIHCLEEHLQNQATEKGLLDDSLQQKMCQLQEKENQIKALEVEKDSLKEDSSRCLQSLTEKEVYEQQLRKELADAVEEKTSTLDKLKEENGRISILESEIVALETKLASSVSLIEKEEAVSELTKQQQEEHKSLAYQIQMLTESLDALNQDKTAAVNHAEQWKNKLSDWKKKAESKFTQSQSTIKSLQSKLDEAEKQLRIKGEQLEQLTANTEKHILSKSEADQMVKEKEKQIEELTIEIQDYNARQKKLEEDLQQLIAEMQQKNHVTETEKKELLVQLQEATTQVSDKNNIIDKMEIKLKDLQNLSESLQKQIQTQQENFENSQAETMQNKKDEMKAIEDRFSAENAVKLTDLKKKAEQKIAMLKKQFTTQVEEKELEIRNLEAEMQTLKDKLCAEQETIKDLQDQTRESQNSKEEMKILLEKAKEVSELEKEICLQNLKEVYEEKICSLQNALAIKEQKVTESLIEKQEAEKTECNKQEELLGRLQEQEEEKLRQVTEIKTLQAQLLEQIEKHSALLSQQEEHSAAFADLQKQLQEKEVKLQELNDSVDSLEKHLQERETSEKSWEQKYREIQKLASKEQEDFALEKECLAKEHEAKLKSLHQQLGDTEALLEAYQTGTEEKTKADDDLQKLISDMRTQQKELHTKLEEAESEKQKFRKDVSRLQKDMRSLRKEHQQELEYVKKEIHEENEKKLKLELEDLEMKHSSTLKQLMREFNTQIAKKDQEMETAVKEAISKAQEVEGELLQSHRVEVNQLHKSIVQKEDDLNRTARKYEEILQSREEEMTVKVDELQKLTEKLQAELNTERNQKIEGVNVKEIQAQLAQKTTLLSEAKLKEQAFHEKIHTLEDKLKILHRNSVVTHFGTPYKDGNHHGDSLSEPTEFEYLRKVIYEYMMGRETKTMAKVITTVLKFPPDLTQKILEKEDSRPLTWLR
ncbi:golgin subfamily A member 4 isoform X2 [Erpetoichthys calabaricus]|uniref:golgin subfamily A member 4 isoform X2 n=1 Tax=Erpetoichthys calabaricus TaxID=27687 RepID=UPI00223423C0|nr:golgin subfamily A member 4 isoform X2 [Erpetoichthys calabaricus]